MKNISSHVHRTRSLYLLGVLFQISDEHTHPIYMGVPSWRTLFHCTGQSCSRSPRSFWLAPRNARVLGTFRAVMHVVTGRFAYKSIRLHRGRFAYTTKVVPPTRSESIRLHWSRFAYTNRKSSYTKGTENLKWYVCTPKSFVEANSRLSSVRHKLILFCYTRETSSRIFLSPVFCAYIEFYKITELLRRSHWSIAVFRWEYVNTVVTF